MAVAVSDVAQAPINTSTTYMQSEHQSLTGQLQSLLFHVGSFASSAFSPSLSTTTLESSAISKHPLVSEVSICSTEKSCLSSREDPAQDSALSASPPQISHKPASRWQTLHYAYPPPRSRHHLRPRSEPQLLLQLRLGRGRHKAPLPHVEVYPALSALRHRKQPKPLIGKGSHGTSHGVSKNDLLLTKYADEPHGHIRDRQDDSGIIALLHYCNCTMNKNGGHHDLVFILNSSWIVTANHDRYTFQNDDTSTSCICLIARPHSRALSRSVSAPISPAGRNRDQTRPKAFDLVVKTAAGVEINTARIEESGIRIRDLSTGVDEMKGILLPHSLASHVACNSAAGRGAASHLVYDGSPASTHRHITYLAIATGIWVAVQEGWLNTGVEFKEAAQSLGVQPRAIELGRTTGKKLLDLGKGLMRKRCLTA